MYANIQQLRADLMTHRNTELARRYGRHHTTIKRWRAALGVPPFGRGTTGEGPTQHAILAALQPPGTWHAKATLTGLRPYDLTYALQALMRKGRLQRRGRPYTYEYALCAEE